jgi:REP element-mobilizing transposase RayT
MSYVSNHVHIVFSTTNRLRLISQEMQQKLWAYIAGIAKNHAMHAVAVGGIEDHVHVLVNLGATHSIAKPVQVLKANSSRWMNHRPGVRFQWQEKYFACSVSRSQVSTVRRYIANQREHHHKMDAAQEFELLLKRHGFDVQG